MAEDSLGGLANTIEARGKGSPPATVAADEGVVKGGKKGRIASRRF